MSGVLCRTRHCPVWIAYRQFSSRRLTNREVKEKRKALFDEEKARQASLVTRVEKIQVEHRGVPEECTLLMNKHLSTPFNCAMHIGEVVVKRSVLALVNGEPWDMHRPLVEDCQLQFLHFKESDPTLVNQTFWRSCSFILGHVLETAFKDRFSVQLCSFPKPNVQSGSFVYDVDLGMGDWKPTSTELNCLSRLGSRLGAEDLRFERLEVDASVAQEMFEDNRYKSAQIPSIAACSQTGTTITLYRMGAHIDISSGPLMASSSLVQRYSVTAVHDIESPEFGKLQRVQGVAVPWQLPIHFWTYERLAERAGKLNPASLPRLKPSQTKQSSASDAQRL